MSEEMRGLTKPESFLWRGARQRAAALLCHMALSLGLCGDGVSFQGVSANHSDSASSLVMHTLLTPGGFQPEGFWEVGRTFGLACPLSF